MGYVIAVIIVLLLVAGFVTFFVLNAARRSGGAAPSDPGDEGTPAGIAAPDEAPLGDTTQHAEGQASEGEPPADGDQDQRPRVGDPGPEANAEPNRLADRPR